MKSFPVYIGGGRYRRFTEEDLPAFEARVELAAEEGWKTLIFEGDSYLTTYAQHIIRYLQRRLRGQLSDQPAGDTEAGR